MAVEVGRGYVDIVPDLKGFQDKVGREVEQATSKASQRAQKAIDVGSKLTAGVTLPVVAALGAAGKMASDLEQSVGAVENVFGESSDTIFEWGETAAQAAGLARQEVNQMGAVVGAQLKGMGFDAEDAAEETVKLQQRAADMAAQFGGPTSQAVEAISALLRGERDTIEKYGVSLKQAEIDARIMALGLDTSTVAAEKQATAIASLDLLYDQTADAAGTFADENDTAAGSAQTAQAEFKNAAAALGEDLLPIMADAARLGSGIINVFEDLPGPVQTGVVALAGVAAAAGPISVAAGGAIKGIQGIKRATTALRTAKVASTAANVAEGYSAIGASAANSIPSVRRLATGVTVGLTAAVGVYALWASEQADARREVEELTNSLDDQTGAITDNTRAVTVNRLEQEGVLDQADRLGISLELVTDAALGNADAMAELDQQTRSFKEGAKTDADLWDAILGRDNAQNDAIALSTRVQELSGDLTEAQKAARRKADAMDADAEATDDAAGAATKAAGAVAELTGGLEGQAESAWNAQEAMQALSDEQKAALDPVFALNDAFQSVEEAQEAYTDAVDKHGKESAEAEQAAFDLAAAQTDLEEAAIKGDLSFEAFSDKLDRWVADGKLTAAQADVMRSRVKELRKEAEAVEGSYRLDMQLEASGAFAKLDALRAQLLAISGGDFRLSVGGSGGVAQGRAHGGPVAPDETYWVGEEGPELFRPDSAGQVVSHDNSVRELADSIVASLRGQQAAAIHVGDGGSVIGEVQAWSGPFSLDDVVGELDHKLAMRGIR